MKVCQYSSIHSFVLSVILSSFLSVYQTSSTPTNSRPWNPVKHLCKPFLSYDVYIRIMHLREKFIFVTQIIFMHLCQRFVQVLQTEYMHHVPRQSFIFVPCTMHMHHAPPLKLHFSSSNNVHVSCTSVKASF